MPSELTYRALAKAVSDLATTSARNAETIHANATWMSEEARDTARIADQIGARRVDNITVGETHEVSKIMQGLSEAVLAYAVAGDTTSRAATAAHDANRDSHDGINEATARSTVGHDVYEVDRGWFERE
jgi:hypothetical protein